MMNKMEMFQLRNMRHKMVEMKNELNDMIDYIDIMTTECTDEYVSDGEVQETLDKIFGETKAEKLERQLELLRNKMGKSTNKDYEKRLQKQEKELMLAILDEL